MTHQLEPFVPCLILDPELSHKYIYDPDMLKGRYINVQLHYIDVLVIFDAL